MVQDMNLIDLITASGGLIDASYTLSSELTRVSVSEKKYAAIRHLKIVDLYKIEKIFRNLLH